MSQKTNLHVINHTHWDREWFVPYNFTGKWIPRLILNLDKMVSENSKYEFLFDAQTLVIDDLEETDPESFAVAQRLIRNKNLKIGPYYAQCDLRMSGAESIIRNLRIGVDKTVDMGGATDFTAWQVDIFGHESQSPQIHKFFGIDNIYLWRGPDCLEPFFWWNGPDGTRMLAVDLFAGGYRNFYRVTTIDKLALPRLEHEARKLSPFYPKGHIPVFDGFDLDSEPGDAATYFATHHALDLKEAGIDVISSNPLQFAKNIRDHSEGIPEMSGEHISGKYSSVFPGTLSSRIYSKLAIGHAERLLYRYAEPLNSLLPAGQYPEDIFDYHAKQIQQNLVHDVISGCSIDQVHQIAEVRTQEIDKSLKDKTATALSVISNSLQDGHYAYLPSTGKTDTQIANNGHLYHVTGNGVSIIRVDEASELSETTRQVETFNWKNDHYEATLRADGTIQFDQDGSFGQLVIREEAGDTYWDEPRGDVSALTVDGPLTVSNEAGTFTQVSFDAHASFGSASVSAHVMLTFDASATVKWNITLNTTGTGYTVILRHAYASNPEKLRVGMQFDDVERSFQDTNLLGAKLDPGLRDAINESSQRDLVQTFTFPFHTYISPVLPSNKVHILAKSLHAYQTEKPGNVDIVLSRPVEWLMKPTHHKYHSGDAGPKYYVPDARSQRETTIECALLIDKNGPDSIGFHQAADQYLCEPLLFTVEGSQGNETHLSLFDEPAVISSLHSYKGERVVRAYNPTATHQQLSRNYATLAHDNQQDEPLQAITPKRIANISLQALPRVSGGGTAHATILNWAAYPIGPDNSKPDPAMIEELKAMYARLQQELDALTVLLKDSGEEAPHKLQHKYYVVARECMEAKLSLLWNERRANQPDNVSVDYLTAEGDQELYELGTHYNDLRVMRRMYDYIIGIDEHNDVVALPTAKHVSESEKTVLDKTKKQ